MASRKATVTTDLDELEELLRLLRKHGVTKYRRPDGFELELGPERVAAPRDPEERSASRASSAETTPAGRPKSLYDHPSLWSGGKKPSFHDE